MFLETFLQVAILFVMIFIGFALAKFKVLTEKGVSSMTDMVLLIVTPCVIIKSFIRPFETQVLKELLLSFLLSFLSLLFFILVSRLLFLKSEENTKRVLQFGIIFSNCGYMSLPLQQALLGDNGVFFASSYIAMFNLLIWSYGILLMSGDKKYLTPKKILINPGIIGIAIGFIIFLLSIPMPKIIVEPISYLASLNTPLPMIIIGFHLAHSNIFAAFKSIKFLFSILLRLVLLPIAVLLLMYICSIKGDMLISLTISCCAPTAAISTMFSSKFNRDTELSVSMVSVSTLLSIVTMPLVISFAQYLSVL